MTTTPIARKCCASVLQFGWPGKCGCTAKVTVDGKHYCLRHNPERKATDKELARAALRKEQYRKERADIRLRQAAPELLAALVKLYQVVHHGMPLEDEKAAMDAASVAIHLATGESL